MFKIKFKKIKQIYFCVLNILNLLFVSNTASSIFVIPPPPPPPPVLRVPATLTPEQIRAARQQEIQASQNLTALKALSKKYVNRLNELLIEATSKFFKKFQFNEELPKAPEYYDASLNRKEEIFIGTLDKEIIDNKADNSSNKSILEKQLEDNQAKLAGLIVGSEEYNKLESSVKKLEAKLNAKKEADKLDPFTKLFNFFKNPEYKNSLIKVFQNKAGKFLYKYFKDKDGKVLTQPEQEFYDQISKIITVVEEYEKDITEYNLKKSAAYEQFKLENKAELDKNLKNIETKFNLTFFESNKIELANILATTNNNIIPNKPTWFSGFNSSLDLEETNFIKQFTRLVPKLNDPLTTLFNKFKEDLNVFNKIFRNKDGIVLYKYFRDKDDNLLSQQEVLDKINTSLDVDKKISLEDIKSFYTNIKKVITELKTYRESVSSYFKKLDTDKKEADAKLAERVKLEAAADAKLKEENEAAQLERQKHDSTESGDLKNTIIDLQNKLDLALAESAKLKKELDSSKKISFEEAKKEIISFTNLDAVLPEIQEEFDSNLKLINPIEAEKFKKELADLKAENLSLMAQKKAADSQKIFEEYKKIVSKLSFSISGRNCNKKNLELIKSNVKNLVKSGLDINKLFDNNTLTPYTLTPLMYAISIKACPEFITFLIKELKADKNLKNSNNLTALDLVKNILSPAKSKSRLNPRLRARLNSIKNILEKK